MFFSLLWIDFPNLSQKDPSFEKFGHVIKPLTARAFRQKHIFWTFWSLSAWVWAKLHVAPIYSKRHLQHNSYIEVLLRQKSKFQVATVSVVAGNFAASFSLKFLSFFMHISGSIELIVLIWASLERSFPPADLEYRWCQFWLKVMTLEVEQRPTLVTTGYGRHGSQWVKPLLFYYQLSFSLSLSWDTFHIVKCITLDIHS